MAAESTAISLTSSFYLNNFYRYNRNAIKTLDRKEFSTTELSYEDTRALKRALSKLDDFDYDSNEEASENMLSAINAFAATYNHTLETSSSKDSDLYRLNRQLKELSKKYEAGLDDLGIRLDDDGKMKISQDILKGSTAKELGKVFSEDSDYMRGMKRISKRMNNEAYDDVYAMLTGCGGRLNIIL